MSTNIRIHLEYKKRGEKGYRYGGKYTGEWPFGIIRLLCGYGHRKPMFPHSQPDLDNYWRVSGMQGNGVQAVPRRISIRVAKTLRPSV